MLGNANEQLRFQTKSGLLRATRDGDNITLDFPLNPCTPEDPSPLQELIKLTVGGLPLADVQYSASTGKLLLRLSDATSKSELEALNPDTPAMMGAHKGKIKGVIVTVKGSGDYDFFSRYFAPWVGIPEDPVTGAAHTVLASYWSSELGKSEMLARQCSKRGGDVRVTVGREPGRVYLAGKAYIVMQGKLYLLVVLTSKYSSFTNPLPLWVGSLVPRLLFHLQVIVPCLWYNTKHAWANILLIVLELWQVLWVLHGGKKNYYSKEIKRCNGVC